VIGENHLLQGGILKEFYRHNKLRLRCDATCSICSSRGLWATYILASNVGTGIFEKYARTGYELLNTILTGSTSI
jgi:hypothetical protein